MLSSLALLLCTHAFAASRPSDDNLTRAQAEARSRQVESVGYRVFLSFDKGQDEYRGRTTLKLKLRRTTEPLSVDFVSKKIVSLRVNGQELKKYPSRTGSFDVPAAFLKPETTMEVEYVNAFDRDGHGVSKAIDPEDKNEYIISDSEPYYIHRLFPALDQPDLKASFQVEVEAPGDWVAISNDLIDKKEAAGPGRTLTHFHPTRPISPYLVFVGVGPFHEWKDKAGDVPLEIYARQSLVKFVDAKNIFDITKKGLAFYGEYFGYKFPFPKYGQVFVPEFAWGGMENPGAVALNEKGIFRGPVTQIRIEGRHDLILHEMAHMWFGDLVTMKWWDDLWLNESFATYLSAIAQSRAMKNPDIWQAFFHGKGWGYWQDQLVTSHPIETPVADIRTVKGNFDGITYSKGAAALKQLHFFVGEEAFRQGLKSYFQKHAFKNATRKDFVDELAAASQKDLGVWTESWLQSAGPNRVESHWQCQSGKLSSFEIWQSPNLSKKLSPHRTRVGLFRKVGGELKSDHVEEVYYSAEKTPVPALVGKRCPDFVYPNLDDQDFALVALDPVSLKLAPEALKGAVAAPLLRLMLWHTLAEMARDTKLSVSAFMDVALQALAAEKDERLLGVLLGRHNSLADQYLYYLRPEERKTLAPRFEKVLWTRLEEQAPGSNLQMVLFDFYVRIARSPEALTRLREELAGQNLPRGLKLDQDRRWDLVRALAAQGHPTAQSLIEAEKKSDPSTEGLRRAYAAQAARPDLSIKKKYWHDFQAKKESPTNLDEASRLFDSPDFPALAQTFVKPYFAELRRQDWKASDNWVELYFDNLFPRSLCSAELLKQSQNELETSSRLSSLARRSWLEANDELARCVKVREKSAAPTPASVF